MSFIIDRLPWSAVDPTGRTFDPGPAAEIAARIVRPLAQRKGLSEEDRRRCARGLDLALITHYGASMAGWNWSVSDGGPVRAWCCAPHSVLGGSSSAGDTVGRVVAAVVEWRAFLEELAQMQATLLDETASLPSEDRIERAVVRYVPMVVARTGCEDAWYHTLQTVLRWHLDAIGDGDPRLEAALEATISGRFHSWVRPDGSVIAEAAAELGLQVSEVLSTTPDTSDGLGQWWITRGRTEWRSVVQRSPVPTPTDGHRDFIARHDAARSPERAHRMGEALRFIRQEARAQRPLSWTMLREAQRRVLGVEATEFRSGDAFAHRGRERYGLDSGTSARFERCLAEARDASLPPVARAARAYLDVCFFHPFSDGNARAARLALDHALTSAGLGLHTADPVFLLPRRADDPGVGWSFAHLLGMLVGPTR